MSRITSVKTFKRKRIEKKKYIVIVAFQKANVESDREDKTKIRQNIKYYYDFCRFSKHKIVIKVNYDFLFPNVE